MTFSSKSQERKEQEEGKSGGKIGWKLSEVNTKAVYGGQNELIGELKMETGEVIRIGRQVMKYTYIPTGIRRDLVWIATRIGCWKTIHPPPTIPTIYPFRS